MFWQGVYMFIFNLFNLETTKKCSESRQITVNLRVNWAEFSSFWGLHLENEQAILKILQTSLATSLLISWELQKSKFVYTTTQERRRWDSQDCGLGWVQCLPCFQAKPPPASPSIKLLILLSCWRRCHRCRGRCRCSGYGLKNFGCSFIFSTGILFRFWLLRKRHNLLYQELSVLWKRDTTGKKRNEYTMAC